MHRAGKRDSRGFSLIELMIVVVIFATLIGIAGLNYKNWMDKYRAEAQVKMMHADIMQARLKALEKNRQQFVVLNGSSYQVIDDTNDNGTQDAAPNDTVLISRTLSYPTTTNVTIILDTKGIISTATNTISPLIGVPIGFNTGGVSPEYDCFLLYATRISIGKMNGVDCVTR